MEYDTERFSTVPLFEGLASREISDLLRITQDVRADEGMEVIRQGQIGDAFYVIGAGEFEVLKTGKEKVVLARLQQLSYFGEMSMVSAEPRSASVICVSSGRLKKFPISKFNKLLDEGNVTAYKVIRNMCRILAQRLARLEERFVS
ncbi:MAG: cyclic nucleotide-binding domain-containing protein [Planctomycetota bacterium]